MIAVHKLSTHLASFDFFNWLVMVKAAGATEILFDISNPRLKNFTLESVMQRYESILKPGPAMAGLPYSEGTGLEGINPHVTGLWNWYDAGGRFDRLVSVKPPMMCDYTVRLRNNHDGSPARNSDRDSWCKFAERINAVLIEDYFDKPIHLHDRVALYAGAKMNFGVCNGPMQLLTMTSYPVTIFVNTIAAQNSQTRLSGRKWGTKYNWMLPNQHMVWKEDSLDNLLRFFEENKFDRN